MSGTRRQRSPGRSASFAASGGSTCQPGERRTVEFTLHAEQFAYTGADMRRVIEPGRVGIFVGRSSDDLPLCATIELTGPVIDLAVRRRFLTRTAVR